MTPTIVQKYPAVERRMPPGRQDDVQPAVAVEVTDTHATCELGRFKG
jgi:hypothetical protein